MSPASTTKTTATTRKHSKKFPVERADELLNPSRVEILDPQTVFGYLPMRVYQEIADIGCGPGYFTIPLAKYAFDGKIHGVDIQQEMLDKTQAALTEARLSNGVLHLSKESKLPLDDGSIDGALLVNSLHEVTKPSALLKEAHRALRRGGWGAIIDWRKEDMEKGPPTEARISRDDAVAAASEAGFKIVSVYDLNRWEYIVLLSR
ncbi:MAG: class I SAM-dependent methyltransferase [Chloroflexi bacterium]|nr:class I SAM-dependent methyltransferase [Chloroflexota bacterium]